MDIIRLEVYFLYPDQTHRVYLNKSFYCVKVKVRSLSCAQLFVTPWTVTHQAPLSMGFSRQEYWSGLPFPSPGIFLTQRWNSGLWHCRQTLYPLSHQGIILLFTKGQIFMSSTLYP